MIHDIVVVVMWIEREHHENTIHHRHHRHHHHLVSDKSAVRIESESKRFRNYHVNVEATATIFM